MAILKNQVVRKYTQIPNWIINNTQISDGAYRLLAYLYSKPDNWVIRQYNIAKDLNVSKSTVSSRIAELKDFGLISIIRNGQDYEYHLYSEKFDILGTQNIGTQDIGTQDSGIHINTIPLVRLNNSNTEEKIIAKKPKKSEIEVVENYFENQKVNILFAKFLQMRKEMKKKATPLAIKALVNKLNKYDDEIKIKAIEKSIESNYQGVFPESINDRPSKQDEHAKKMQMLQDI